MPGRLLRCEPAAVPNEHHVPALEARALPGLHVRRCPGLLRGPAPVRRGRGDVPGRDLRPPLAAVPDAGQLPGRLGAGAVPVQLRDLRRGRGGVRGRLAAALRGRGRGAGALPGRQLPGRPPPVPLARHLPRGLPAALRGRHLRGLQRPVRRPGAGGPPQVRAGPRQVPGHRPLRPRAGALPHRHHLPGRVQEVPGRDLPTGLPGAHRRHRPGGVRRRRGPLPAGRRRALVPAAARGLPERGGLPRLAAGAVHRPLVRRGPRGVPAAPDDVHQVPVQRRLVPARAEPLRDGDDVHGRLVRVLGQHLPPGPGGLPAADRLPRVQPAPLQRRLVPREPAGVPREPRVRRGHAGQVPRRRPGVPGVAVRLPRSVHAPPRR
mmetsp:Transcript_14631/g.35703  ORF Transcript_14631/g.35703 Transcript_14631/m.35703 type:complete len:377 (-) Transcript_14631:334-1464(-)